MNERLLAINLYLEDEETTVGTCLMIQAPRIGEAIRLLGSGKQQDSWWRVVDVGYIAPNTPNLLSSMVCNEAYLIVKPK